MTLQWKRLNYLLREILRSYQETKKKKRMNELLRWTKRSVYMFLCKYNLSSSAPFQLLAPGSRVHQGHLLRRVTCFTTCSFPAAASPSCDSRRSEGESGGEHALTTSHVELKQEKNSFLFFIFYFYDSPGM